MWSDASHTQSISSNKSTNILRIGNLDCHYFLLTEILQEFKLVKTIFTVCDQSCSDMPKVLKKANLHTLRMDGWITLMISTIRYQEEPLGCVVFTLPN